MVNMFCLLPVLCAFLPVLSQVSSIKVTKDVNLLRYAELGGNLTLDCKYRLEGLDELHQIKWYRYEAEIYRYSPSEKPRIFPMTGFNVSASSKNDRLIVTNLTLGASGNFKCEVSTGSPKYETDAVTYNVTVVGKMEFPKSRPAISGIKPRYTMGDEVRAECRVQNSYPPATIQWYINDHAAEPLNNTEEISGPVQSQAGDKGPWPDSVVSADIGEEVTSELRFKITERHVSGSIMRVKCAASIPLVYWQTCEEEAKVVRPHAYLSVFPTGSFYSSPATIQELAASSCILAAVVYMYS